MKRLALALVAIGLAGCAAVPLGPTTELSETTLDDLVARQRIWDTNDVDDYTMRVTFLCECSNGGTFDVVVADGVPVRGVGPQGPLTELDLAGDLTIDRLYELAATDLKGGGTVSASWDGGGVPRHLVLDPIPNAIDDELELTVDAFEPAPAQ